MKVTKKLLNQIRKTINSDFKYKGYQIEIGLRTDMASLINDDFNCLLFAENNHDLADLYPINELYKWNIKDAGQGIELDIWLYDDEYLQEQCSIYCRKIKNNIYHMSLKPIENGELIKEAVRALKHK